jgi:hypothetical protein
MAMIDTSANLGTRANLGKAPAKHETSLAVALIALAVIFTITGCGPSQPSGDSADNATPPPMAISQADLALAFEASKNIVFEAKTAADFAIVKAEKQVNITPTDAGLKVIATSNDPTLMLSQLAAGTKTILQVVIEAPVETSIQLFYATKTNNKYVEAQSQLLPLKAGKNTVYFQLDSDVQGPLRLDPGAAQGVYIIESLAVRAAAGP